MKTKIKLFTLSFHLTIASFSNANFYKIIAQENLKSLANIENDQKEGFCSFIEKIDNQSFGSVVKTKLEKQLNPNTHDKRRLIFSLLDEYEKNHETPTTSIIDIKTIQDLELLCGSKSNPQFYLGSQIDRTITESGRIALYKRLIQPTSNTEELQSQQEIIKELVNNQELFNELNDTLKNLTIPENVVLSFWDSEDIFKMMLEQNKVLNIPFLEKIKSFKKLSRWVNRSEKILEGRGRIITVFDWVSTALMLYGAVELPFYAITGKNITDKLPIKDFNKIAPYTITGAMCWAFGRVFSEQWNSRITGSIATNNYARGLYYYYVEWDTEKIIVNGFQTKMSHVANYINSLQKIASITSQNPILNQKLTTVKKFNKNLEKLASKSNDLKHLFRLLQTNTIKKKENANRFLDFWSRIRVAYILMTDLKNDFIDAMLAVGELDAQLSIAKLYKEFENKDVKFCFPTYLKETATPAFSIQESWNPMIAPEKVITNNINIGSTYHSSPNAIITGPNAGGKSTIMKGFISAAIMAQSLGIAPAKEFALTPFKNIITYLNITDDIAAGNSYFKAGVIRARDLIETVENNTDGFTLTAADEVFGGTNNAEGQAAAKSLIQTLGENNNNICITNTHFPLITDLQKETGLFTNYKVSVEYDQNGNIAYPYKLENGISHQKIALKILREEGFGDVFLDRAQNTLENINNL
ncbi:MAG: hypothetical protein UR26_C0002G0154 [candidate division TM6 bacterium GW2011_GWF2_32_72]|nr:MAG: hypothetical protein UR26_C0002G0154 [candidate division TM6 bacterium GW2011_GWF2_32_72]